MTTINKVDFELVAKDAIAAAKTAANNDAIWKNLEDIIKNITDSLNADVQLIAKRKKSGEFNENDAAVFLDDQKMVARMRIRSIAIIGLKLAEDIWNAIAKVFSTAINKALGWTLL
jgi:hypothetical protein